MTRNEEREAFTIENRGERIFGILHRPVNTAKAPIIVFCQGFEGNKCGKLGLYVSLAQELAKAGFIVARFDYRGSGDSEGDTNQLTIEDKVSDTLCVIEYLSKDPQVNRDQVGILGRSLGGAIAILAAHAYANIHSIVLWAPVFDGLHWKELWIKSQQEPSSKGVQEELKKIPGEIPNKEFLKQLFSLNLGDKLPALQSTPLLHIHGEKDSIVNIGHADAFKSACQSFQKSKFVRLPSTDHDFSLSPERFKAVHETVDWFKDTLR